MRSSSKKSRKCKFSDTNQGVNRLREQTKGKSEVLIILEFNFTDEANNDPMLNILGDDLQEFEEITYSQSLLTVAPVTYNEPNEIQKPPRTPKMDKKRPFNSKNKSSLILKSKQSNEFACIPAHTLNQIIEKPIEDSIEVDNALGYNFEELDFHEENNTEQENYKLKTHPLKRDSSGLKFKSKRMQEIADKYVDE